MGEARRDTSVNRTRTILISGASRGIGLAVASRAQALEMKVLGYDPFL